MIDTLTTISENHPDDELFLLLGDDSLETFAQWKDPQGICRLAMPLVVNRPGSDQVDLTVLEPYFDGATMDQVRSSQINSPLIEISSTDIRERTAAGHSIRFLTPRSVEKYIETQKLYLA